MLQDHMVCGIRDHHIWKCLLVEPKLTFDQALELTLANESAEHNAVQLQKPSQTPTAQVCKLGEKNSTASQNRKSPSTCYHCGGKHQQRDCPFKEAECHRCKKKGHLAQECHSKTKQTQPQQTFH